MEPVYLTVVSDGRQQWGYQSDDQGRRVQPVPVARVMQVSEQPVGTR